MRLSNAELMEKIVEVVREEGRGFPIESPVKTVFRALALHGPSDEMVAAGMHVPNRPQDGYAVYLEKVFTAMISALAEAKD